MEHKILIADDSLTIQKVIKITLANEPFELKECPEADKLVSMVKSFDPTIVLLDFNLSENKTGYDLCREIKSINPSIGVLMLFGTFDTIDEELLSGCGCNYHIIKPFDGTKFINLCRAMTADFESIQEDESESDFSMDSYDMESSSSNEGPKEDSEEALDEIPDKIEEGSDFSEEDEWVMSQPGFDEDEPEEDLIEEDEALSGSQPNHLDEEVESWGMAVPSVIGEQQDESSIEIPSIIDERSADSAQEEESATLPDSSDLEYPELGVLSSREQESEGPKVSEKAAIDYPEFNSDELEVERTKEPRSKLVPLDQLNLKDEDQEGVEIASGGTDTEEAVKKLEEQIRDEVEDEEEEDLWAADIVEEGAGLEENLREVQEQDEDENEDTFKAFDRESVETVEVDDLPRVEPHNLHKVPDNSPDNSGVETPEDFPSDVMEEEKSTGSVSNAPGFAEPGLNKEDFDSLGEELKARIEEDLADKLSPLVERYVQDYLKEYVKEYCKAQVEKVAWEVIPDLAENIIKKEIQKITDSILDQ